MVLTLKIHSSFKGSQIYYPTMVSLQSLLELPVSWRMCELLCISLSNSSLSVRSVILFIGILTADGYIGSDCRVFQGYILILTYLPSMNQLTIKGLNFQSVHNNEWGYVYLNLFNLQVLLLCCGIVQLPSILV